MSLIAMPNPSPEPMRVIAVSSASRLDVIWSRMAQLRMLGIQRCVSHGRASIQHTIGFGSGHF